MKATFPILNLIKEMPGDEIVFLMKHPKIGSGKITRRVVVDLHRVSKRNKPQKTNLKK